MQTPKLLPAPSLPITPTTGFDDVHQGPLVHDVQPVNCKAKRKLRQFKVSDLMKTELPPQQFIVEGLLPTGLCVLAGAPKMGKSWAALDLALSVASGRPFLGRPTHQGAVLYLALEDTQRRLQDRLKKIGDGVKWDELPLDFATEIDPIDAGGLEALRDWLEQAEDPRLIVIDVWGRFGPRESSSKKEYEQITHTLQPLQALANKHEVAMVSIHHTRKSSGDMKSSADPFDDILGSRGFASNMDVAMLLTRARMRSEAVLFMTGRDVEEGEIPLKFDGEKFRWQATDQVSGPALSPERQRVMDAVAAGHVKGTDIAAHIGKQRTAVANHLTELVRDGFLIRLGGGSYGLASDEPAIGTDDLSADMTDTSDTGLLGSLSDLI